MSDSDIPIDDALLDRLVDQELSADRQRQLLIALDEEPGGWRRVALAFIEAQAWRCSLRAMIEEPTRKERPNVSQAQRNMQTPCWNAWRPLALAAGLFLAFTLGILWRGGDPSPSQPNQFAGSARIDDNPTPVVAQQAPIPWNDSPSTSGRSSEDALMLLVEGDGQPSQQVPVTLVQAPDIDSRIPSQFAPTVPEPFRRRLERLGYQVETQRRYAPIPLQGGRQMYVPVVDTRIMPVHMTVY